MSEPRATGRCFCGAVTYEVRGPLRDVTLCHCVECRRWSGSVGAFTAAKREHVVVAGETLRWIESRDSDRQYRRGFCSMCGSSVVLQARGSEHTHVAAGTLDVPTGLRISGHWYTHQAGDWDTLHEDGRPRDEELARSERRWT